MGHIVLVIHACMYMMGTVYLVVCQWWCFFIVGYLDLCLLLHQFVPFWTSWMVLEFGLRVTQSVLMCEWVIEVVLVQLGLGTTTDTVANFLLSYVPVLYS